MYVKLSERCQMLVNSRCFPDEVIFNRLLADVRVLSVMYDITVSSKKRFTSLISRVLLKSDWQG